MRTAPLRSLAQPSTRTWANANVRTSVTVLSSAAATPSAKPTATGPTASARTDSLEIRMRRKLDVKRNSVQLMLTVLEIVSAKILDALHHLKVTKYFQFFLVLQWVSKSSIQIVVYILFSDSHFGAACLLELNPSLREVADILFVSYR